MLKPKVLRRLKRKQQLRVNNKFKKTLFANLAFHGCFYCKKAFLVENLTIEHIIPLSLGGTNDISNITLACAPCNQKRGRETWFLKKQLLKTDFVLQQNLNKLL